MTGGWTVLYRLNSAAVVGRTVHVYRAGFCPVGFAFLGGAVIAWYYVILRGIFRDQLDGTRMFRAYDMLIDEVFKSTGPRS